MELESEVLYIVGTIVLFTMIGFVIFILNRRKKSKSRAMKHFSWQCFWLSISILVLSRYVILQPIIAQYTPRGGNSRVNSATVCIGFFAWALSMLECMAGIDAFLRPSEEEKRETGGTENRI